MPGRRDNADLQDGVAIVAPDDPPPPLPSTPQRLDTAAAWVDEVDVHRLLSLP